MSREPTGLNVVTCIVYVQVEQGEVSQNLKMKRKIILISMVGNLSKPSLIYPSLFKSIYFYTVKPIKIRY